MIVVGALILRCISIKEPGEGAAIVHEELIKIFIFSLFSVFRPFIVNWLFVNAPPVLLVFRDEEVLVDISFRASVPVSTIRANSSVLEVESLVAGHACVELGLEPNDSNFLVDSATIFVTAPTPDFKEIRASRNLLEMRVPFHLVIFVCCVESIRECALVVQLIWNHDIFSTNLCAIRVFVSNDADTCGKRMWCTLNQLPLYGLDLNPVRTSWSLVKSL